MTPPAAVPARLGAVRKIAIVSAHASPLAAPGGVEGGAQSAYVAHLAGQLAQAGYLVDIFTRRAAPGQAQLLAWRERVRVVHVPAGPARHVPKEQALPHMDAFARFVTRFARRQAQRYDVAHANFFLSGMVAQQLKRTLGVPYVITFHALGQVRRPDQDAADAFPPERYAIELGLMRGADRILAACPQDRHDMERLYGAARSRIEIAPRGFDPLELRPEPMAAARRRLGLAADKFIVLQLGRMAPHKGIDNVIESLALLRAAHGVDAELLVVGGAAAEAPELARLRALAAALGLADHVRFAGRQPREALRHYYSAANAFVATPWHEPSGITAVEAMACATPVIGAAIGAIRGTVLDGQTGYLVPPREPAALAAKLAALHADPALARRMGREGLRRAHRHHTWHSVAQQAAAIYEAVAGGATARGPAPPAPAAKIDFSEL